MSSVQREDVPHSRGGRARIAITILLIGAAIGGMAYANRERLREKWLKSQPIDALLAENARTDADALVQVETARALLNSDRLSEALPVALACSRFSNSSQADCAGGNLSNTAAESGAGVELRRGPRKN